MIQISKASKLSHKLKNIYEMVIKRIIQGAVFALFNLLNRMITIRFGIVNERALGHLNLDTEINFLRKTKLKNKFDFWVMSGGTVNHTLSQFWRDFLPARGGILALKLYHILSKDKKFSQNLINKEIEPGEGSELDGYGSVYTFTPEKLSTAQVDFELLELDVNKKLILLCLRDESYYLRNSRKQLEMLHTHRNVDVNRYKAGVEFLLKSGYQVVRMGRDAIYPLGIQSKDFIDLPFEKRIATEAIGVQRRENLELFIARQSSFAISTGLGTDSFATLFRKRVYLCDYFSTFYLYGSKLFPFFLPKGLIYRDTGRILNAREVFESEFFRLKFAYEFDRIGVEFIDCDTNQIERFFSSLIEQEQSSYSKIPQNYISHISVLHEEAFRKAGVNSEYVPKISPLWKNYFV